MLYNTGIEKIDKLLNTATEPGLREGDSEPAAVGVVHDLLRQFDPKLSQLLPRLPQLPKKRWRPAPLPDHPLYGVYTAHTTALVRAFQQVQNLTPSLSASPGHVDHVTAKALLATHKQQALVTPAELIFNHKQQYSHFLLAVVLTGGRECVFDFSRLNRNDDGAGLSAGILHWSQSQKRLYELMVRLRETLPETVNRLFGGAEKIELVLAHLERGQAGLTNKGWSIHPALEFAKPQPQQPNWTHCFRMLLRVPEVQSAMTDYALKTYRKTYDAAYADYPSTGPLPGTDMKQYAPKLVSARAVVFGLDMINQFGNRLRTFYQQATTAHPTAEGNELLKLIRDEAHAFLVSKGKLKLAESSNARRDFFLSTPQLPDQPFLP